MFFWKVPRWSNGSTYSGLSYPIVIVVLPVCAPPERPAACRLGPISGRLQERLALGRDGSQQLVPGLDEGLRPIVLKLSGQRVDVDPGPGDPGQPFLAVPA